MSALRSAFSCKVTPVLFITIELFSSLGFQIDKVLPSLMKRYSSLLHIVSMATSASAQVESVLGSLCTSYKGNYHFQANNTY